MRLDEAAHGSEIRLRLGQELDVVLVEARTAGYRWAVVSDGSPVCRLERDRFEPPPPVPGAPGRHTWTFSAIQAGAAEIELAYARSFGGAGSARRFTLRVIAE
jgi:predicted secreted protein